MTSVGKVLFAAAALAASGYSMLAFGPGMWSWIFVGVGLTVLVSVFLPQLDLAASMLGRVSGVLSGLAFFLLMLAATVGGSFNMSESNVVFAVMLAVLAVLGLSAFYWRSRARPDRADTPLASGSVSDKEHGAN